MDAMRIVRDEWEAMWEQGDHFCLDTPAHLLAYVRARAYAGAEDAWREWTAMRAALNDLPLTAAQEQRAWHQLARASRLQVAYLQVLVSTVEMFAPAPQRETHDG